MIEDWAPVFKLDVGAPVQWDEGSQGAISTLGASCVTLRVNAPLDGYKGAWTLTVSELVGFTPGGSNTQQRLAGPWVFRFMLK